MPEFQSNAEQFFAVGTDNTWQIVGNPGSYSMSNGSMSTPIFVDRIGADGTAFIRYAHPISKTVAQEAIVNTDQRHAV